MKQLRSSVRACSLLGWAQAWGRGLGGGLLLFSLAHFLGLLVSSLCGSGDRDDP